MGRKAAEFEYKLPSRERANTFNKRARGLLKKGAELAEMTGCHVQIRIIPEYYAIQAQMAANRVSRMGTDNIMRNMASVATEVYEAVQIAQETYTASQNNALVIEEPVELCSGNETDVNCSMAALINLNRMQRFIGRDSMRTMYRNLKTNDKQIVKQEKTRDRQTKLVTNDARSVRRNHSQ
jgi:hypothetical protein